MPTRFAIFLLTLVAAALLAVPSGCDHDRPDGTPPEWLSDARTLEAQGAYFQENREKAPLGALEYYKLYLQAAPANAPDRAAVQEQVDWLEALKLMTEEDFQNKANYPAAIAAMTAFREKHPKSVNAGLALFYRGLSREYDIDHPAMPAALADYRQFIAENPQDSLVPEVLVRIAHCYAFDLDKPDYDRAIETCDQIIAQFGPTDEAVAKAPPVARAAVERALFNKARILDDYVVKRAAAADDRPAYARAAECYERLTHDIFYDAARFKHFQFIHYRLGCILAENLGRKEEGAEVLWDMTKRWRESPMYGCVIAKLEQIEGRKLQPGPYDDEAPATAPAAGPGAALPQTAPGGARKEWTP